MNVFVFRPGGVQAQNVFNDWQALMTAMSGVEGRKTLEFDDSLLPPANRHCDIPAGTWPMKDVMWAGFGPRPGVVRTTVHILSGAVFTNFRMIAGQITIVNKVLQAEGGIPPVSDFTSPDQVHIGIRDDSGASQIVNEGDVPLFDVGSESPFFFVQNCVFGMPRPGIVPISPLIRHTGAQSRLSINLLGLNQTGPRLVLSEAGASVLFGAISNAAQVAADQSSISGDNFDFGPQGRIQRHVIPRPPKPPATGSQPFNKPNVLIRCDGSAGFTQQLPSITSGFTIGNTSVTLYSGGQEVVIAEVAGGSGLRVGPASGDTIDGDTGLVKIGKHGSRTFVSDGSSNWITISQVE